MRKRGLLKDHMRPPEERPPQLKPEPINPPEAEKPPVQDAADPGNGGVDGNGAIADVGSTEGMIMLGLFALVLCSFSLLRD